MKDPNGGSCFNISKETTKRELLKIVDVDERKVRMNGINLSGGFTNAVEIATNLFGLPNFDKLLDDFKNKS